MAYVEPPLTPTLRAGDVVVIDNLAAHKVQGARTAISATGARLRRPEFAVGGERLGIVA